MWDTFKPDESVWYCWRLNGAAAYLRKNGDMWQIAFKTIPFSERTGDFGGPETEDPPESLAITCAWGTGEDVFLHPYLSDIPYVLRFREKVRIAPGEEVCFTAALPPLLKFELKPGHSSPETVLGEAMPITMRQTLFGPDIMRGKIGHSLGAVLLPKQAVETTAPSALIHCEIIIKNSAKTTAEPEHFTVYPEPLNVYVREDCLAADQQELEITGVEKKFHISQISDNGCRLVSPGVKSWVGGFFKNIARGII